MLEFICSIVLFQLTKCFSFFVFLGTVNVTNVWPDYRLNNTTLFPVISVRLSDQQSATIKTSAKRVISWPPGETQFT